MSIIWEYAVAGVNFTIPGNGGPECVQYLPLWQRIAETILLVPLSIYGIIISSKNLEVPSFDHRSQNQQSSEDTFVPSTTSTPCESLISTAASVSADNMVTLNSESDNSARYSIIAFYSFIFGTELIFKLITRTCIFLLNPCHVASVLQIVLLTMQINKRKTCMLFRFHMYLLSGALMALAFPVINTRLLPGEVFIYFVQHLLILTIPFFMVRLGDAFSPESFENVAWPVLSFSIIVLYHYTLLQVIALLTQVNVSCILCPAVSDPFRGRFYRLATITHQGILVPLVTKIYNRCAACIIETVHCFTKNSCSSNDCTNSSNKKSD